MDNHKGKQGFASMLPERQREIAATGGRAVRPENRGFSRDPELAAKAGRKGGKSTAPEKRSFSIDHALASAAGRKGAAAPREARR
jgi:general stress protein YciG